MTIPAHLTAFWAEFSAASGNDPMDHFGEAYHFDDNQQSADELAELVLRGVKRATAGLVWSFEVEGRAIPKVGDLNVVTDWSGNPMCVIETV